MNISQCIEAVHTLKSCDFSHNANPTPKFYAGNFNTRYATKQSIFVSYPRGSGPATPCVMTTTYHSLKLCHQFVGTEKFVHQKFFTPWLLDYKDLDEIPVQHLASEPCNTWLYIIAERPDPVGQSSDMIAYLAYSKDHITKVMQYIRS